jgi:2-polyprenyl-3-methyl-5-hydroxy-6-metoxy-1,4-benzoquinol methylase
MQWIAVLGRVEDEIVEAFERGGGVPYEAFHRFHEVMRDESAQTVVAALLDHILPLEARLEHRLEEGIEVLDVGCGAGRAVMRLAEAFPKSRFTGYDLCEEAIAMARRDAEAAGHSNVRFEVRDVAGLAEADRYDLITAFDAIHDQADPAAVLGAIHRSLEPDGTFLMQDIDSSSHLHKNLEHPLGTFLYTISCMHCMTVSLAQGGAGLGTCWGVELAQQMLREAGFSRVDVHRLSHDVFNCFFIVRK